jgi:hypothetical protein
MVHATVQPDKRQMAPADAAVLLAQQILIGMVRHAHLVQPVIHCASAVHTPQPTTLSTVIKLARTYL